MRPESGPDLQSSALARILLGILAVGGACLLKLHFGQADGLQLAWLLRPTAALVALLSGLEFVYHGVEGFHNAARNVLIAPACSGINFLAICLVTGTLLGRHKLIPWVSPGKTWEGLVGGLVLSGGVAMLAIVLSRQVADDPRFHQLAEMPLWRAAFIGILFGITGQAGDLLASVLKRDARLKDSGHSLPGFGGVLDVVDSVLLVAPVAFWALKGY